MNTKNSILKCTGCNAVIEVLDECTCTENCTFTCCGKPMTLMQEKTADMATEKHVPVPSALQSGDTKVVVGSTPHPMTPEHYIEWIEIIDGPRSERIRLKPGDAPEALFQLKLKPGVVIREYCNIHGLWVNNL